MANHFWSMAAPGCDTHNPLEKPGRLNKRRGRRWPKEPYRRQMKRRFFGQVYHQRWQVESLISRLKRRLGSALRSRIWQTQKQECRLRVLTHNLMLVSYAL